MKTDNLIHSYIGSQPSHKGSDMLLLHHKILGLMPGCKLWFLDGKNSEGKVVSNPNIGYGSVFLESAGGNTKEFYRVGMSANTTGISVYIMGIRDKSFLKEAYGKTIGKATVTGYCIKFRSLKDIQLDVLESAIRAGTQGGH